MIIRTLGSWREVQHVSFKTRFVATVIFKTMRLRRFEIKAKEFICKLSSFNQNVGGEEMRADDTPMMDGW